LYGLIFAFRLNKLKSPTVEITPVNGNPVDNILLGLPAKKPLVGATPSKGSKLESALDRLGFQKRKVPDFFSFFCGHPKVRHPKTGHPKSDSECIFWPFPQLLVLSSPCPKAVK
jgi:hypothetical protein